MIEDDERKLLVRRIFRNGRRRYDAASKERLVAACLEAGVSVSRLALEHGVNANLLRKWIKTAKEAGTLRAPARSAFIPVQVSAASHLVGGPALSGEARQSKSPSLSTKVSACLPNGVTLSLECGDVEALKAIIGALGHVQTER